MLLQVWVERCCAGVCVVVSGSQIDEVNEQRVYGASRRGQGTGSISITLASIVRGRDAVR
jgi:hypothetical protein